MHNGQSGGGGGDPPSSQYTEEMMNQLRQQFDIHQIILNQQQRVAQQQFQFQNYLQLNPQAAAPAPLSTAHLDPAQLAPLFQTLPTMQLLLQNQVQAIPQNALHLLHQPIAMSPQPAPILHQPPPPSTPVLYPSTEAAQAAANIEQFIAIEEAANAVPRATQRALSPLRQVAVPVQASAPSPVPPPPPVSIPVLQVAPQPLVQTPRPVHSAAPTPSPAPTPAPAQVPAPSSAPPPEEQRRRRGGGRKRKQVPEPPPRVDEALAYLRIIKLTFSQDVPIYHRFLEIMKDFRAQRIDTPDVIEQVAELLYTSPDLVLGFNTFLPAGFHISLTDDNRYVFTSPKSQPRVLPCPEGHSGAVAPNDGGADTPGDDESGMEEDDDSREDDKESADAEESDEEDVEDGELLFEEVVRSEDHVEFLEDKGYDEQLEDLDTETLRLIDLLSTSFTARPSKFVDFRTFMDYYLAHCEYYKKKKTLVKDEPENSDPQEGPAPPATSPDRGETVQVDGEKNDEKKTEETKKDSLEESNRVHIVSMLASVCMGEKELLAATLEFLPYLQDAIDQYGTPLVEKIRSILHHSDPLENEDDIPKPEIADAEFFRQLERKKIGKDANEKLRISGKNSKREKEELAVLDKTERVLYDHLKARTTKLQLKNILTLMNMFTNMDISDETLAGELPKFMGVHGSEAEVMIRKMLGLHIEPWERPENDKDAVMKCDVPVQKQKRGLREQKQLQQVKVVQAATVCTLGPSYRLMKDMKSEACEGRIEMDPELKEVLNDTWTSYPSWSSEEVGTTAIKKSNLEEFHCKTEDERYEMDIIIDSNRTIIEQLSKTLRDIESMSDEERRAFKLDEKLNCSSKATFMRVLTKIYTNQVFEMIEATQRNMVVGLKKILEGLKEKDVIWSKFQQEVNKTWRDVLDKTLSANINVLNNQQKQYDQKAFKSKPLVNAIEAVYEERRKKEIDDKSPHLILEYHSEPRIYRDINDVTSHFFGDVQGGKHDRDRSKIVLYRVLMDWLCQPQQHVQVNTYDGDTFTFNGDEDEDINLLTLLATVDGNELNNERRTTEPFSILSPPGISKTERFQRDLHHLRKRVFFGDDSVYMIIRYHHMILERFARLIAQQAIYNQEYLESQKKHQRWADGVGADMHGQKTLSENMKSRRDAVNDIRNVRSLPSAYYDLTIREMKNLGINQIDLPAFEEAVRQVFPGEVVLFNSIDKLFNSLVKNIHHATCEDSSENPVKLYLKYRGLMDECGNEEELERVVAMYATDAEEILRGKNTYKFEFVAERNAPFCNIWVIPREEKDSDDEDVDDNDDGKDDGKDDKDGGESSEFGGKDGEDKGQQQPPSNSEEDDEEMEETPMTPGGSGETEGSQENEIPDAEVDRIMRIRQTGCDMETAFGGEYKNDKFFTVISNPGVKHRIYPRCVREHKLWLLRTKLVSREWRQIPKGMWKVNRRQQFRKCDNNNYLTISKNVNQTVADSTLANY